MADWLQGKVPFNPVPIAGVRARGQNSFLPIPYSKHCKVTNDAGDFYYHVNYRTYAQGAAVRTFTRAEAEQNKDLIDRIARELAAPRATSGPSRERKLSIPVKLEPGASRTIRMRRATSRPMRRNWPRVCFYPAIPRRSIWDSSAPKRLGPPSFSGWMKASR